MQYLLKVTSKAIQGREGEYNQWYDNTHIHDVLSLPGFNACQRFQSLTPDDDGRTVFTAVYEVETDNPEALLQSLFAATPTMTLTDSIDTESVGFEFLLPMGEKQASSR